MGELARNDASWSTRCAGVRSVRGWEGDADLVEVIEECAACVAAEAECEFHAGFAAGWDACVAAMASYVEAERLAELVPVVDEIEERRS